MCQKENLQLLLGNCNKISLSVNNKYKNAEWKLLYPVAASRFKMKEYSIVEFSCAAGKC